MSSKKTKIKFASRKEEKENVRHWQESESEEEEEKDPELVLKESIESAKRDLATFKSLNCKLAQSVVENTVDQLELQLDKLQRKKNKKSPKALPKADILKQLAEEETELQKDLSALDDDYSRMKGQSWSISKDIIENNLQQLRDDIEELHLEIEEVKKSPE